MQWHNFSNKTLNIGMNCPSHILQCVFYDISSYARECQHKSLKMNGEKTALSGGKFCVPKAIMLYISQIIKRIIPKV